MQHKIFLVLALVISLFPFSSVRVLLYRLIFSYKISQSKIGWLSVIAINNLKMDNASIGSCNFFTGPFEVEMKKKSHIGSLNFFRSGQWTKEFENEKILILEKEASIINQHYFDLFGRIFIGERTIIAGVRSQFWTHGSFVSDIDIKIGKDCYIGSGVKFAAGTEVADNSLCALGSVVTKKFMNANTFIAGVPAKVIKEEISWRENWK